jgi:hypothetical protein
MDEGKPFYWSRTKIFVFWIGGIKIEEYENRIQLFLNWKQTLNIANRNHTNTLFADSCYEGLQKKKDGQPQPIVVGLVRWLVDFQYAIKGKK